ncbi:ornithine cyclodeaminase family protein [Microbispora sp. NPDC046933]|uniref:ornithine cyclodeaminase family protein n=1 Tax=Microbispora sp. NPDC046933 TaxID=3155618 RepID=UPI0033C25A3B
MTLFLTDADVRAAFDWATSIAALRAAYAAPMDEAGFPPRVMARSDGLWLRTLSGVMGDGSLMGGKTIAASVRHRRASYLIQLFDQETVELVALLDGNAITGFRTASTSALAADVLAPAGPLNVGVIGSGFEARHHVRALAAVRELSSVTVFSPNPNSRTRFLEHLADLGLSMRAADSAPAAVAGADLVVCAARSSDERPTLRAEWLEAGMTVVSIGSTLPEQREVDTEVIARAGLIVADQMDEVVNDTGDMIAAKQTGIVFADRLRSLGDVVSGRVPGRRSAEDIVVYKSVGGAVQDLAVAAMCVRRAVELSIGTVLPVGINPVAK